MSAYTLRTSKGIKTADREALLIEPTFADNVDDFLGTGGENFDGDNVKTLLTSLAGDGLTRWSNRFTYSMVAHGEQFEFFKYQEHLHGRSRSVWIPSWRSDFNVLTNVSPASGNRLRVSPNGFEFVYSANRYGLMIQSTGLLLDVFSIIGYDRNLGDLILNDDFDVTIAQRDINRCCLVRRARSSSDRFEWDYLSDAVAQVGVSFLEVFNEGAFQ